MAVDVTLTLVMQRYFPIYLARHLNVHLHQ